MTEIELKAHIEDPEQVKKELFCRGIYECAYEKNDTYWVFSKKRGQTADEVQEKSLPPPGLRLRRETKTGKDGESSEIYLATYKIRELRAGIEINDEREFEVSGGAVLEDLLRRLGLEPGIEKHKQGWAWRLDVPESAAGPDAAVRAELSQVTGLGWFLELEILVPEGDEKTINRCRERLFFYLDKLGIPRNAIESRPYTEMLKALR